MIDISQVIIYYFSYPKHHEWLGGVPGSFLDLTISQGWAWPEAEHEPLPVEGWTEALHHPCHWPPHTPCDHPASSLCGAANEEKDSFFSNFENSMIILKYKFVFKILSFTKDNFQPKTIFPVELREQKDNSSLME